MKPLFGQTRGVPRRYRPMGVLEAERESLTLPVTLVVGCVGLMVLAFFLNRI